MSEQRVGPRLSATDTQAMLDAAWVVYNRCEEDGIPEPFIEMMRFDSGEVELSVSWYPSIYPHQREGLDPAQVEKTFAVTLTKIEGTGNLTYAGPALELDRIDFTIYN